MEINIVIDIKFEQKFSFNNFMPIDVLQSFDEIFLMLLLGNKYIVLKELVEFYLFQGLLFQTNLFLIQFGLYLEKVDIFQVFFFFNIQLHFKLLQLFLLDENLIFEGLLFTFFLFTKLLYILFFLVKTLRDNSSLLLLFFYPGSCLFHLFIVLLYSLTEFVLVLFHLIPQAFILLKGSLLLLLDLKFLLFNLLYTQFLLILIWDDRSIY